MKKSVEIFVIAVLLARPLALPAQTTPGGVGPSPATMPSALQNVGFEPQLGGQVPLDVPFEDESSRSVQLRDYFHRKPVVLAFVDRKSTRLNSSHVESSYAVFCLKKKKKK